MDKRMTAFAAALMMCAALTGCGGKTESAAESDAPVVGGAVTKQVTEVTAEETETVETEAEETDTNEEEGSEVAKDYEGSLTRAFAEKLEQRSFTIDKTLSVSYGGEGLEDEYSEMLEVNGSDYHFMRIYSGDFTNGESLIDDIYHIDGADYRADSESRTAQPVTAADVLESGVTEYLLGHDFEAEEFISAESFSDGTVAETFETEDGTMVLTFDGETGVLISLEKPETKVPGDKKASALIMINGFEEGCEEIKLPEGYEELVP